jgi:hypothetical protein
MSTENATPETEDTSTWPVVLRDLAAIVGAPLALVLAEQFGGLSNMWIPSRTDKAHPWRSIIEDDAQWAAVVKRFGGGRIHIPLGSRRGSPLKTAIIDRLEAGAGARDIARELRTTERYVRRVAAMMGGVPAATARKGDPRQRTLF